MIAVQSPWHSQTFLLGLLAVAVLAPGGQVSSVEAEESSQVREINGIQFGGDAMMVFVARDKTAWEAVKKEVGRAPIPADRLNEPGLSPLDHVDFQKDMIVAVFWGKMNFSGHGENCWIQDVTAGKKEVTVNCRAILWGGQILRSYTAYPYAVRVVPQSELPVKFIQTVDYKADAGLSEKPKTLATLGPKEWKHEIANKPENSVVR
jgi:hypothetical protein